LTKNDFDHLIREFQINSNFPIEISSRVAGAMFAIDRKDFVPDNYKFNAYYNSALPTFCGQTVSQPEIVFSMTCLLECRKSDKILEIGTGVGYQTAVLSGLAKEVITIERIEKLHNIAKKNIQRYSSDNIQFILSNGARGYEKEAPYDRILVTAAMQQEIFFKLPQQLKESGILVAPVYLNDGMQQVWKLVKTQGEITIEYLYYCVFVPVIDKD